jgi:hypothetical protein
MERFMKLIFNPDKLISIDEMEAIEKNNTAFTNLLTNLIGGIYDFRDYKFRERQHGEPQR